MRDLWEKIKQVNWADRRLITIIVIVILVFLMMDFNNRMTTMIRLGNEEAGLQTRIAELKGTQVKLETKLPMPHLKLLWKNGHAKVTA